MTGIALWKGKFGQMKSGDRAISFNYSDSIRILRGIARADVNCEFDPAVLRCVFRDAEGREFARFRCPPAFPVATALSDPGAYGGQVDAEPPEAFVLVLQAGQAALARTRRGLIYEHRIIRKYMVRKSQGKAQLTHLKTKGKSRLGSRIRLQQSVEFFEEINSWLTDRNEEFAPGRILYACAASLWPHLFHSRIAPPFDKKDARLMKIPRDFRKATLEELERMCRFVLRGQLVYDPAMAAAEALLRALEITADDHDRSATEMASD